jgi:tetratricopeptide (TPR) repeat protein
MLGPGGLLLLLATGAVPAETAAAREQARLCETLVGAPSVNACKGALALGIHGERAVFVRRILARRLASLERWSELVELYREEVARLPLDPASHLRLGQAVLFGLGQAEAAEPSLREAARLEPSAAWTWAALGVCLQAQARSEEARAAFEEALRLDAGVLEDRPGTRAAFEAAREGTTWP